MPGPLPEPNARRRNAPRIPTTRLKASGLGSPAPVSPLTLGDLGREWWEWAWGLPQAAGWSDGDLWALARRARMEDPKLVTVKVGDELRPMEVEGGTATEKLALDDRFGLTAKGLAALRWVIVEDEKPAEAVESPKVASLQDRRSKITRAS